MAEKVERAVPAPLARDAFVLLLDPTGRPVRDDDPPAVPGVGGFLPPTALAPRPVAGWVRARLGAAAAVGYEVWRLYGCWWR